jgi:hypothetical protein
MTENYSCKTFCKQSIAVCIYLLLAVALPACNAQSTDDKEKKPSVNPASIPDYVPQKVNLTLTGYNYTNRSIPSFSVGGEFGVSGGDIGVSTPTSGGGGSACCVTHYLGAKPKTKTIRWQVDACTYDERTYSNGEKMSSTYRFFKEFEVQIDPHIPDAPRYFEVHFYPDGHVEAAFTEQASKPRLQLPASREDRSDYKKCPNDKKPQE